jgi:PAS domain S-box-containing protein
MAAVAGIRADTEADRSGVTRALLAAIVDSSRDAIISKTLEGTVTSWNTGAEELYGYAAPEIIGQPITLLLPLDRRNEFPGIMARIRRGVRVEPYDTERVRKDGRRIHVSLTVSPVRDTDGTIVGASAIARDITERKWTEAALAAEREVLELATRGAPAGTTLDRLARTIEAVAGDGLLASILLLDEDGTHLRHGAAPSLPDAYTRAIDGTAIGPAAGSCGTAAYRLEPVVVEDVASDPLWADYRHLALPHGLRACWSTPILGSDGRVLGTFAIYYREPRRPSAEHLRLAALVGRTAAAVLERTRAEEVRARLEAEREELLAGERRAREAADRARHLLEVQHALGRVLAEASLSEAPPRILQTVCEGLGWACGAFWEVDEAAGVLRCVTVWRGPHEALGAFEEVSRRSRFASGRGLPGRVWASREPRWIPDLAQDEGFVRATAAAQAGLRSALAFPVRSGGRVVGVAECFGASVRPHEDDLLAAAATLGSQIGQFIERRRADEGLRESEERFRELFELAPVGYQELDAEGRFVRVNRALCDLLGYTEEELLGRAIWEFEWAHGEPAEETRRKFLHKLATGETWRGVERVRVRKDGTLRTVWVEDRLVRDASGQVVGLRSAQVDISERKRAEAERDRLLEAERAARAAAEEALRTRDQFVAFLAHDLKNLLTGIKGHAQLLRRRAVRGQALAPEQALAGLATIETATRRMETQIDDLLDATRLRAGKPLDLRRRPTDLVALARQAVEQQQATDRHRLRLTATVPSLDGEWDADRLERVLDNLLGNAVKYSPQGGEIGVEVAAEDGAAVLTVRDHGVGIPAADLPHVFERFWRAGNVEGRIAGTGLGLAGAKDIVEQHGGTIAVESAEGRGSTFTVRLPLNPGAAA